MCFTRNHNLLDPLINLSGDNGFWILRRGAGRGCGRWIFLAGTGLWNACGDLVDPKSRISVGAEIDLENEGMPVFSGAGPLFLPMGRSQKRSANSFFGSFAGPVVFLEFIAEPFADVDDPLPIKRVDRQGDFA